MIWKTDKHQIENPKKSLWLQSSQSQSIYLMSPSVSLLLSTLHTNCCHVPVSIRIFRSHSQPSQLYTCHLSAQSWDSIQCIFDLTLTLFSTRSLISLNNPTILQQVYKGQEQNSFNFLWKRKDGKCIWQICNSFAKKKENGRDKSTIKLFLIIFGNFTGSKLLLLLWSLEKKAVTHLFALLMIHSLR